jgi:hypothetical protein
VSPAFSNRDPGQNLVPAAHVEGLYSCLDYYQNVSDPFSKNLIKSVQQLYIAQASNAVFRVVKSLGVIDPKEASVPAAQRALAPAI